jgi:D-aminopeptidase
MPRLRMGQLVQANHGQRRRLAVNGVPVGRMFDDVPLPAGPLVPGSEGAGSIIVLIATDAPLLTSAPGWPSGRGSASLGSAGSANTPAATCSSASPPATAG